MDTDIYRRPLYGDDAPDELAPAQDFIQQPQAYKAPDNAKDLDWGDLTKHAAASIGGGGASQPGTVQSGGIGKWRSSIMNFF